MTILPLVLKYSASVSPDHAAFRLYFERSALNNRNCCHQN